MRKWLLLILITICLAVPALSYSKEVPPTTSPTYEEVVDELGKMYLKLFGLATKYIYELPQFQALPESDKNQFFAETLSLVVKSITGEHTQFIEGHQIFVSFEARIPEPQIIIMIKVVDKEVPLVLEYRLDGIQPQRPTPEQKRYNGNTISV